MSIAREFGLIPLLAILTAGSLPYAVAFKKGALVCIEGEPRSRAYESNAGKVRTYDIVASSGQNLCAGQRTAAAVPEEAAAIGGLRHTSPDPPTTCRASSLRRFCRI